MKHQQGFSLIEVVIGILILGILGITLLQGLSTAVAVRNMANVRTTAESFATTQIEKIKTGAYSIAQSGTANYTSTISTIQDGFQFGTLDASGNKAIGSIYGIPWDITTDTRWSSTGDPGIQKITIIVESNKEILSNGAYKEIFRLTDFKVNR